ncbi:hypothetical protein INT44_007437, partial [Umbelopsis vinacea]
REKKHVAEASDLSSHLSDTSSLSSDPPGSGGSEKDSDDEDDDNRSRGVKPKATSKKATKKQAADSKRKNQAKSKQPTAAAAKSKVNRPKSIPEKKSKDSHHNSSDQYCICRGGYNGKEFMVACDQCHEWFHGRCIGISEKNVPDHYYCDNCQQESEDIIESSPAKKGKKSSKAKTGKAKGTAAAKTQRNKAEIKVEPPPIVETVIKTSLVEQDADIDLEDEDLDDICPVCDSECTCGSKVKTETIPIPVTEPVAPSTTGNNFVHDSGVIEIIGEDTTQPKRGKAKTKEKKGKDKSGSDKPSTNKKRSNTKKPQVIPKLEIEEESMDDDDVASVTENVAYMSDMSDAVQSSGSYLEGPVYSYSEGSLHIDSGDDEDIEEEEERAMIEQWELLQDQDELSDSSSEEDFDLDDEETMAIMLEDQVESDEDIYTNDFIHQVNEWSSDEDDEEEEGYEEELDESDIDNVFDNEEENFDDDEYDSEDGDSGSMQFSPFFDENTDVSELLDNIAAALALSISLPSDTGEQASDLTQQLQRALIDAGIDLSTIDEQHLDSSISEVDEPVTSITPASNDSDVDVTGSPDDSTSPIAQLEHQPTAPIIIEESESATALSQSLVSDLLLASGQGGSSKIDSELIAAAVQDIVNAATGNAKQGMLSSAHNNGNLLETSPLTPNSSLSFGDTSPVPESSASSSLKRGLEEGGNSDRQQKRRLSVSKEPVKDEIEHSAVLMDDLVDTSRLYTRSTSRSPSPEPAEINRFSQDLSRWQRVPIGTFRRSRRVSAPMIQASAALKSGNDEFASTLLCDLEDSSATNPYNATVPKKRRRPKHRGRSAAKSMSDLASIIQKSKDLLPANFNALQGDQSSLASNGLASNNATISLAIANAVAAIRQSNGGRRPIRQGSLSSGLDTDQPPSSACSSPLYSPLFAGIRNTDLSIPDLHLDDVVAELQKQEEEKSAAQQKGRRPSKLSSALT